MINILADKYIYKLNQFLPDEVNLTLYDPQEPLTKIPAQTHALFTRTITEVDVALIAQFPPSLKFVATASAGTDHIDIKGLNKKGITFTNAAGCNARAVAEYVATALLIWADARSIRPQDLAVGIVGVGNTGGETQDILHSLGVKTIAYDPPRAERDGQFKSAALSEVLNSDVLTFHVPLTFSGKLPTFHWLDEKKVSHRFQLIINASRGGVVDEQALFYAFQNGTVTDYILDVWENEPVFNDKAAKSALIHTPHIAGYSIQAKLNASRIVVQAFCQFYNLKMPLQTEPKNKVEVVFSEKATLANVLKQLHPIGEYHQKFSNLIGAANSIKTKGFSHIRTHHTLRNEYPHLNVSPHSIKPFPVLSQLIKP